MVFTDGKRRRYMVQRGIAGGLFLTGGCVMLFPVAEGLLFAAFGVGLAAAGIVDLACRLVLNRLCLFLGLLGIVRSCFFIPNLAGHLLGAVMASLLIFLMKFLFRTGLGGGDVKLIAASSLFLGGLPVLRGVFFGCLLALCAGVLRWLLQKRVSNCELAFVPFLAIGFLGAAFLDKLRKETKNTSADIDRKFQSVV